MPTFTFQINNKCSAVIRAPGVRITTLDGRINTNDISFNTYSYNELSMRRKAEVLQYKGRDNVNTQISKRSDFSNLIQSKGTYSQARIKQLISLRSSPEDECKVVKTPGTNSGIRGGANFLLYYDPKVPYIVTNAQSMINPNHL
jgi:hypothetical protein